ncbi:MAG: septum formation protein Maf [candidate division NC10 bacterium]|nr:septum formation protein Maf [candidate division NC10 bacterium]
MNAETCPSHPAPLIILASASPRRAELLQKIGLPFQVIPSGHGEEGEFPVDPELRALSLARVKARDVARRFKEGLVIGADTLVAVEDLVLGKPRDREEAGRFLRSLRGKLHRVMTGVAVVEAGSLKEEAAVEVTWVKMRAFSDEEVEAYLQTGEPFDKAGGYAIQGRGALFIEAIHGDYSNVVGLPLGKLRTLLLKFGVDPLRRIFC